MKIDFTTQNLNNSIKPVKSSSREAYELASNQNRAIEKIQKQRTKVSLKGIKKIDILI